MTKKEKSVYFVEKLKERYPEAVCSLKADSPFQLLVATRLSAQCTDARVNLVTPQLFEKYPTPNTMAEATYKQIEDIIQSCGLYKTKAKSLVDMAIMLRDEYGGEVPNTLEELIKLPGIGRKTANLIMGDVFGAPSSVVADTHLIRIANRFGLVASKDPYQVEMALRKILPPTESNDFCHRIVHFGREVCTARNPQCETCSCNEVCAKKGIYKKG